jgi:hypothetical protein
VIAVAGALIGLSMVVGTAAAAVPIAGVALLFVACVLAAISVSLHPLGRVAMVLAVPMMAAGMSYDSLGDTVPSALLITAGSVVTWLVSLCWPEQPEQPEHPGRPRAPEQLPRRDEMLHYGIRLGIAGAVCAAAGFAFGFDHEGWAAAACLLVMRPSYEMTRLRAAGRAGFVTIGAAVAVTVAAIDPAPGVVAVLLVLDLVGLAATRQSRWYVTGGFTTFIVLSLLAWNEPGTDWFLQRFLETLLGVAVALIATGPWLTSSASATSPAATAGPPATSKAPSPRRRARTRRDH